MLTFFINSALASQSPLLRYSVHASHHMVLAHKALVRFLEPAMQAKKSEMFRYLDCIIVFLYPRASKKQ